MNHPLYFQNHVLFPSCSLALELRSASFDEDGCFCSIAVLSAAGEYGHGSRGNPDASVLRIAAAATLAAVDPDVVLFDFRELAYQWGDALLRISEPVVRWDPEFPVGFVIASGPRCDAALASLLSPSGGVRPVWLLCDWDAAIAHAKSIALARSRAIDAI